MRKICATILIFAAFMVPAQPSNAFLYKLLGGSDAVQDVANRINETTVRIEQVAGAIIGETDAAMEARIGQVDEVIDDALSRLAAIPQDAEERALKILRETEKSLERIEKEIFADLKKLIFEAECAGRRLTLGTLQEGLGSIGVLLGTGKIRIEPPIPIELGTLCSVNPFCSGKVEFKVVNNFESTAREINEFLLNAIQKIGDGDRASAIPETYRYLALVARRTTCFVGTDDHNPWVKDHIRYTSASNDWNKYVRPERF